MKMRVASGGHVHYSVCVCLQVYYTVLLLLYLVTLKTVNLYTTYSYYSFYMCCKYINVQYYYTIIIFSVSSLVQTEHTQLIVYRVFLITYQSTIILSQE